MAVLSFPLSPTNGQLYPAGAGTNGVCQYRYDSAKGTWEVVFAIEKVSGGSRVTGNLTAGSFIPSGSTVPTNGIFLPGTNTVGLSTNSTERLRIDSSGRVLVGTSTVRTNIFTGTTQFTPRVQFETATDNFNNGLSLINYSANGYNPVLTLGLSLTNTQGVDALVSNGATAGSLNFVANDGSKFLSAASIGAEIDGGANTNDMPGRLVFSTTADGASSPTERMRLSSSGCLGVGNTSPDSNALRGSFRTPNGTDSALPVVEIRRGNNASGGAGNPEIGLDVQIPGTYNDASLVKGVNVFARHNISTSPTYGVYSEIGGTPNGGPATNAAGYFKATQSDTNGLGTPTAVFADANATIGVSSNGYCVGVTSQTSNYVHNRNFQATSLYTGTATQTVLGITRNGTVVGSIQTTSSSTSYNTSSDYRLKENIEPLTGATARLLEIPVHRFNFIAEPDRTVDGFVAHEVQTVVPEAVTGEKDAVDHNGDPIYQGIDQSKLVPLLTAALQEAVAEIEALKAEMAKVIQAYQDSLPPAPQTEE